MHTATSTVEESIRIGIHLDESTPFATRQHYPQIHLEELKSGNDCPTY